MTKKFVVTLPSEDLDRELRRQILDAGVDPFVIHEPTDYSRILLLVWLVLLAFLLFGGWNLARRARDQMLGGGMLPGVLRSPARRYTGEGPKVTFNDVARL